MILYKNFVLTCSYYNYLRCIGSFCIYHAITVKFIKYLNLKFNKT